MPAAISRATFRRLLLTAVAVPLVVMLSVAVLLAWQVGRLSNAAAVVERNDLVIARANASLKLTLDLETGLRGYLLRGYEVFLQPYHEATQVIDGESAALKSLVSGNPAQLQLLQQIDDARLRWQQWAREEIESRARGVDYATLERGLEGKRQMDHIREMYQRFVAVEDEFRDVRSHQARRESEITLWLVAAAGLVGGGLLALLSRRQFLEISSTYAEALATANDLNNQLERRVEERTLELEKRGEQLREANRELEAFGYSISHDLRAPMRHISGFADLLRSTATGKLDAEEMENLGVIYDTARLAGRMVDDLLEFSRIGRAQVKRERVDLHELVSRCRHELEPDVGGRSVDWVVHPLPVVAADPSLLRMVMQNLLSNAVKYTSRTARARIEIGTLEPDNSNAPPADSHTSLSPDVPSRLIFVRDNGVGFDMAFAGKLFGVFQRLHRSEDFEGTGIGLANVRRILTRHGGKVWAQGSLGGGSTFYFTLPIVAFGEGVDDSAQANSAG